MYVLCTSVLLCTERRRLESRPGVYSMNKTGLGISDKKNNSAEDGIDGTNGYLRQNSGCSAEQKALGIPFRTLQRKKKQLGIPFRGTKIEANSWNSLPNSSAEEETIWNFVPWRKLSEICFEPHSAEVKTTQSRM